MLAIVVCIISFLLGVYLIHIYYQKHTQIFSIIHNNGKPIASNRIEIYAHRGGRGLVPENTLWAYKTALEQGIDYVDMDINMTKDGVLVVYHNTDLNLEITRDQSGKFITKSIPIYELTYSELQRYNVGKINPDTKYASLFPTQHALTHAQIPTLETVIDFVIKNAGNKVGFQIEIKADSNDIKQQPKFYKKYIATLYHLLKEKNIIDRTEIQSFNWSLLLELQSYDSTIKTAYLTAKNSEEIIQKHFPNSHDSHSIPEIIKKIYHGACWGPFEGYITKKDIEVAHQYGIKIVSWGHPPTEHSDFNTNIILSLIQWNIDGITTDRPDRLRSVLASLGYTAPTSIRVKQDSTIMEATCLQEKEQGLRSSL